MFSEFIDEKGVKPLALVCGVSVYTAYGWKRRGIPRDHWDAIMDAWPKLTYRQLRDMEIATRAAAA